MTVVRYRRRPIVTDLVRAGAGLFLTCGPLMLLAPHRYVAIVLAGSAMLFALYGVLALVRHRTVVDYDQTRIASRGLLDRRIDWRDLARLELKYFSTRRDRRAGWMQLSLRGGGGAIRLESTLDGFADIVAVAVEAANQRGLELSASTLGNVETLGAHRQAKTITRDPDAGSTERQRP